MKFLRLVWANLWRKPLRTTLTGLSVFVAFLLFGLLCVVRQSLTAGVSMAGADRLVTRHKVSIIQMLPVSYEARIARIPGVAAVVHQSWFGGIYKDPKNFFPNMPVEPEKYLEMYPEFVLPKAQERAWIADRTGAIIGRSLATRFGWKVGDTVPLMSPIWRRADGSGAWEFHIDGIYDGAKKSTDTSQFFFHYTYFDEGRSFWKGMVGWYTVRVTDPAKAAEVARAIDAEFANSPYETKTEPEGAFAQAFAQQVGDIGAIMMSIQAAVFLTILFVAANTVAQSVRERTEEIGVLKALGFPSGTVFGLVLAESLALALVAGVSGLGLVWLFTLGGSPIPALLPVFYLPTPDIAAGFGLVILLGVLAAAGPAWGAMRLGVADALRRMS